MQVCVHFHQCLTECVYLLHLLHYQNQYCISIANLTTIRTYAWSVKRNCPYFRKFHGVFYVDWLYVFEAEWVEFQNYFSKSGLAVNFGVSVATTFYNSRDYFVSMNCALSHRTNKLHPQPTNYEFKKQRQPDKYSCWR